ncbi:MAG: endonuclease [Bacteroidetes bacterium 41-46]|nr:MAG: endonuclease [Bacteroidetes bacterium 41-46]
MKHFVAITVILSWIALDVATAQSFNIATYNIRYENRADSLNGNGWGQRLPHIANLVRYHDFDIFGSQEVFYSQLNGMLAAMPEYNYIGVGRADGDKSGECSPVFYKRDKFKLIKTGNFWLSEADSIPGKGWDAALPRICTWGRFQIVENGKHFWFFNLHMDHVGKVARLEGSRLVLEKIKNMTEGDPVILTGDFNYDQRAEGYKVISESGLFNDAYVVSMLRYAPNGTFNNFNPQYISDSRIDHIFTTKEFKIVKYGVLTDMYWSKADSSKQAVRIPSDHYPVKAEVILNW